MLMLVEIESNGYSTFGNTTLFSNFFFLGRDFFFVRRLVCAI